MAVLDSFATILFDRTIPPSGRAAAALRAMVLKAMAVLAVLSGLYINSAAAATILVYGDSLSAAYGLASGEGWASLLEERLRQQKFNDQVINASISGETTAGGASRIRATLASSHPSIVILELGANDGLRGLPIAEMKSNLLQIVRACSAAGARVVLVGMRLPPNYGPSYTRSFAQAFADIAAEQKLPYVPFLLEGMADQRELFQADGMHPVASAEPRILDNVWTVLRPLLH